MLPMRQSPILILDRVQILVNNNFTWLKYGGVKGKKMLQVCSICEGKDTDDDNQSKGYCKLSYKQVATKNLMSHQKSPFHVRQAAALCKETILEKMLATELSKEVSKLVFYIYCLFCFA